MQTVEPGEFIRVDAGPKANPSYCPEGQHFTTGPMWVYVPNPRRPLQRPVACDECLKVRSR